MIQGRNTLFVARTEAEVLMKLITGQDWDCNTLLDRVTSEKIAKAGGLSLYRQLGDFLRASHVPAAEPAS